MDDHEQQESEISLLKSMYTEEELMFAKFYKESNSAIVDEVDANSFTLNLKYSDDVVIKLSINIPMEYPSKCLLDVYARCNSIDEAAFNRAIQQFLHNHGIGQLIIFDLVNWINESYEQYLVNDKGGDNAAEQKKSSIVYARLWIYSHHIYSKVKRRNILSLARNLDLRGFVVPGKPALIVVEGDEKSCEAFYSHIRSWNWQKLQVKCRQLSTALLFYRDVEEGDCEQEFCRFPPFSEVPLPTNGDKDGKDIRHFLAEHGFEHMFHEIFIS